MMPLNFVADENLDWPIVERLRSDGHTVLAVVELCPGSADDEVLALASRHHAVLITADKDFGELIYRQQKSAEGVILVRLAGLPPAAKAELVANVVRQFGVNLTAAYTVVSSNTVRHRPQRIAKK